ncbi:MAG: methionyl-tRNA formyltransferase [Chlamydiia bacterium]|nr:methionyl-tRNA formyltransferase [Chlamydiia bacterium]
MLRLVFFGTPPIAASILSLLIAEGFEIAAVVTKPDKPIKRSKKPMPSAVKVVALEKLPNIPLFQPQKAGAPEFVDLLKKLNADVFVVAAYSEIFRENLLSMPRLGCINVHASLLPKYRGAAPIPRAIMAGEKESGVTIMVMDKELDAGAILKMVKTPITPDMTGGELFIKLGELGGKALIEVLHEYEKGSAKPIHQRHVEATFAPKLKPEDRIVHWNNSAQIIHNQIRALHPDPGAYCLIELNGFKKRLMIKKSSVCEGIFGSPGSILSSQSKKLIIGTRDVGLSLKEVQLEGKKSMSIEQFLLGIDKTKLSFPF